MNMTEKEQKVFNAIAETERYYQEIGEDGFNDTMMDDLVSATEYTPRTIKAILGSLVRKEVVTYHDVNGEYHVYSLTNKGCKEAGLNESYL